jgi:hypothetical protein
MGLMNCYVIAALQEANEDGNVQGSDGRLVRQPGYKLELV